MPKKILIVWPSLPFPATGAEQMDRAAELKQLIRLGFEVRIILKLPRRFTFEEAEEKIEKEFGVKVFPVRYKYSDKKLSLAEMIKKILFKLLNPLFFDGAAMEYDEPEVKRIFTEQIVSWRPGAVWFDYTFLWPLYNIAQKNGVKIITRSDDFEPRHFLEEKGRTPINYFKFLPKLASEVIVSRKSDVLFPISTKDAEIYKKLGAKKIVVLPARGLQNFVNCDYSPQEKNVLDVFFFGSTYSVPHNCRAAEFVLRDIAQKTNKKFPGRFKFHILGARFPRELMKYLNKDVVYEGYVENLDKFLKNMDIAVIPSWANSGMQQKVFEPLTRGIPVITNKRGLFGYPFVDGVEVLLAESADEFVLALGKFSSYELRKEISQRAKEKAGKMFSPEKFDDIVLSGINKII